MMFVIFYYMIAIFVIHAAFHMTQTDALKNVVMMFSLEEDDVPPKVKVVKDMDKKIDPLKASLMLYNESLNQTSMISHWFFGFLPKTFHLYIDLIKSKMMQKIDSDSEGSDQDNVNSPE